MSTTTIETGRKPAFDLDNIFGYHTPTPDQVIKYGELRRSALNFARCIITLTPPGADQSSAIRHIREAVMTANAAIALGGRL